MFELISTMWTTHTVWAAIVLIIVAACFFGAVKVLFLSIALALTKNKIVYYNEDAFVVVDEKSKRRKWRLKR